MSDLSRRRFITRGSIGLAALGAGALVLRSGAEPTASSGEIGSYGEYVKSPPTPPAEQAQPRKDWSPTEDNILGPFFREGAPYRAKVTPPLAEGTVLLVSGRVWGADTRKPLAGAVLDVWQADAHGRYDNDDPRHPPAEGAFLNRARLVADEQGYYEFETVHPGAYQIGRDLWRPSHVHYFVRHRGYRELVTQLYFKDDPRNDGDQFIKASLIIELRNQKVREAQYEAGTFDVVLAPA